LHPLESAAFPRRTPKAVVSAVVIDITHLDTGDTPPPVDPVPVTVEIRKLMLNRLVL
jgi:hypothetical protein